MKDRLGRVRGRDAEKEDARFGRGASKMLLGKLAGWE